MQAGDALRESECLQHCRSRFFDGERLMACAVPIESINEMFRRLTSGAVNGLPRKQAVEILSIGPLL